MTDLKARTINKVALIAGLISFLVFFRAVTCDFVNFDDPRFVMENPGIRHLDGNMIIAALTQQFSNDYWAPLTWISFAIDYRFWGLNAAGYHLVNILLHAINTGLVVLLADRLWTLGKNGFHPAGQSVEVGEVIAPSNLPEVFAATESTSIKLTMKRWLGGETGLYSVMLLLAGLLWGIHPLRVESVAWVAERKDVLYGMLALSSILCYLRYAETVMAAEEKGQRYYGCALFLFALALMAKPTSVFVPMLLVVADWYPFRRLQKGQWLKALLEKVPFFALSALVTILTIIKMSITSAPYSYSQFSFTDRLIVAGHSIIEFCRLMIYPTGIHLFNTIAPVLANPVPAYLKTFVVIVFSCYCLFAAKKYPTVIAVWLAFLIPLLPTLPFFQVGVDVAYSTRHSYLPAVVPSIAAVAVIAGVFKKISGYKYRYLRYLIGSLVAAMLIAHAGMTEHLIGSWKNSGTLWSRVIKYNPVGRAYYYRAIYLMDVGQYQAAAADFLIAAESAAEAGNPGAFNYFALGGDAYNRAGRYAEAVAAFSAAIKLSPWPNYYYHRGLALKAMGRLNEAAEDLRSAGGDRGKIEFHDMW